MGSYASPLWGCDIYITYLQLFCTGYLPFLPFIHSFIHIYYHGFMDIYFILWVWVQHYITYFVQIVTTFAIGELFQLSSVSLWHNFIICFGALLYFLILKKYSIFILCILCPSARISHFSSSLVFFYWTMVLETTIWALGVLIATGASLFLCPPSWQLGNVLTCVYTHIYNYFYICPSVYMY